MNNIIESLEINPPKDLNNIYIKPYTYKHRFYNLLNILFKWNTTGFKMLKKAELLLHINGSFGWDKVHKCWVIGKWNDIIDDNGDYVEYCCHTLSTTDKEAYVLKNHEEVIVCGNNLLYTTDNDFIRYFAETLSETDISIYHQLMNSRNIPMLSGIDDNSRKDINNLFEQRKAGVPVAVGTDLLSDIKTLDICDNSSLDRLSTLDNFHEELVKRFCNGFGIDIETKEKKAQVNEMELDSFGDYSTLYFLTMQIARNEFVKEMNENGYNIECVRNPVFWDEPTNEDIEDGEFEMLKKENNNNEKNSNSEGNSEETEKSEQTANDVK